MSTIIYEQIKQVDWQKLGAENVPNWLIGLMSENHSVRLKSYEKLDENFVSKGQVTWEQHPPLSSILADETLTFIVTLLIQILQSDVSFNKKLTLDLLTDTVSNIYFQIGNAEEPYQTRALQLYHLVKADIELYKFLLNDPDSSVRDIARELLSFFEADSFPS